MGFTTFPGTRSSSVLEVPAVLPNIGDGARADRDHHDVIGSKADHRTEGIWHRERLPAAEVPRDFLSG
jgi:hypothetical protein